MTAPPVPTRVPLAQRSFATSFWLAGSGHCGNSAPLKAVPRGSARSNPAVEGNGLPVRLLPNEMSTFRFAGVIVLRVLLADGLKSASRTMKLPFESVASTPPCAVPVTPSATAHAAPIARYFRIWVSPLMAYRGAANYRPAAEEEPSG